MVFRRDGLRSAQKHWVGDALLESRLRWRLRAVLTSNGETVGSRWSVMGGNGAAACRGSRWSSVSSLANVGAMPLASATPSPTVGPSKAGFSAAGRLGAVFVSSDMLLNARVRLASRTLLKPRQRNDAAALRGAFWLDLAWASPRREA